MGPKGLVHPIGIIEESVQNFTSNFDTIIFLVASADARRDSPFMYIDPLLLRLFHATIITPLQSCHKSTVSTQLDRTSGYSASLPLTPLLLHALMGVALLLL